MDDVEKAGIISKLLCVSPIDGRYRNNTSELIEYFSEYGLYKRRVFVEIQYFAHAY